MNNLKTQIKNNKQIFFMLMFIIEPACYFITQFFDLNYTVIDIPFDAKIPFISAFAIPYCLWYLYVPISMIYMCFKDKQTYFRQCLAIFGGFAVCLSVFIIMPTALPDTFRPQSTGGGFFGFVCNIIYALDSPVNVCPSLHCYEALCVHLMTFWGSPLKKKYGLRLLSLILVGLIFISTMFIKQHSFIDVVFGGALALIACTAVYLIFKNKCDK